MDKYEPFDLKITKLTGTKWQRENVAALLKQLFDEQGAPRYSVENRITIAFDRSLTSSAEFLRLNKDKCLEVLLSIAHNPYSFICWLQGYHCWGALALVGNYRRGSKYYEHPLGYGLREPEKAEFENELIKEVEAKSGGIIKANPDPKKHGNDGSIRIDKEKIPPAPTSLVPRFESLRLQVCDYGDGGVQWTNCLPCPLYKDGHCLSRGANIQKSMNKEPR